MTEPETETHISLWVLALGVALVVVAFGWWFRSSGDPTPKVTPFVVQTTAPTTTADAYCFGVSPPGGINAGSLYSYDRMGHCLTDVTTTADPYCGGTAPHVGSLYIYDRSGCLEAVKP